MTDDNEICACTTCEHYVDVEERDALGIEGIEGIVLCAAHQDELGPPEYDLFPHITLNGVPLSQIYPWSEKS